MQFSYLFFSSFFIIKFHDIKTEWAVLHPTLLSSAAPHTPQQIGQTFPLFKHQLFVVFAVTRGSYFERFSSETFIHGSLQTNENSHRCSKLLRPFAAGCTQQ